MPTDRLMTTLPRISGFMVLAIGLAHFVMPTFGYSAGALAAIPEMQRDHFVYLGTYAIGTFLIAFGVMTLLTDANRRSPLETVFLGLMVVVWGARLMLEFVYPVDLSLFLLSNPHPMLVLSIVLIWIGYIAGFAGRISKDRHGYQAG